MSQSQHTVTSTSPHDFVVIDTSLADRIRAARVELSAANVRGDIYSAQAIIERLVFDIGVRVAS